MKIYGQILALAAFAGLVAGCGVTGGDKLRNENKNLKEQVAALQAQLDEANAAIKSYTDMDIDSIKKSAAGNCLAFSASNICPELDVSLW